MFEANKKIVAGVAAAVLIAAVGALWVLWPDEPTAPALDDIDDRDVPLQHPQGWADIDPVERIDVELGDPLRWTDGDDATLLAGPAVDGIDLEWTESDSDGWTTLDASGQSQAAELRIRVWFTERLPVAVIDVEAQVRGEFLGEPLDLTTTVDADGGEFVDGSLSHHLLDGAAGDGTDLLAARLAIDDTNTHLYSSPEATGRIADTAHGVELNWNLWPGVSGFEDCGEDGDGFTRSTSGRLVVQFGDHPLVAPLPVPAGHRAVATPLFVEPTAAGPNPWDDGRSRDALEYARRFRALAFGHSDRSDPRYGNGGLLATNLGGTFAVPSGWWTEEPVRDLRDSLEGTEIEVIPVEPTDDADVRIVDPGDCRAVTTAGGEHSAPVVIRHRNERPPTELPVASPMGPVVEAGNTPANRREVLDRLFAFEHPEGLFADGAHRTGFVPVVATRNPLVDIADEAILQPDARGHWTLHESLTRRLSRYEMSPRSDEYAAMGLGQLAEHRHRHARAVPFWNLDGTLFADTERADHFLATGSNLEFDGESVDGDVVFFERGDGELRYRGDFTSVSWNVVR